MKKFLIYTILICTSLSANAIKGPFGVLEPAKLEVDRPLFDLYYTDLQDKTLDGDVSAYMEGGLRYYYGFSRRLDMQTPKDYKAASRWFYEAAMKGNDKAAYYLGTMYLRGQGVPAEYKTAIWWLSKASKQGLNQATYMLGNVYYQMSSDKRFPESYREFYFEQAKINYKLLDGIAYSRALFNLAYISLKHNDVTRFIKADANGYLMRALPGFIAENDRANAYETLKLMKFNKLADYKKAEELFNANFKSSF